MAVNLRDRAAFFEGCIEETRRSIRIAWVLAFTVFATGILSAILINVLTTIGGLHTDAALVGTIASCIVSLLSAAPLKDYFAQRSKIKGFQYLRDQYTSLSGDPNGPDSPEAQELESIFHGLIKNWVS